MDIKFIEGEKLILIAHIQSNFEDYIFLRGKYQHEYWNHFLLLGIRIFQIP